MMAPITVIGIGEDGLDGLSVAARAALDAADVIAGGARHLDLLGDDKREKYPWSNGGIPADVETLAELAQSKVVAVLATGDPMMHGIGVRLTAHFGAGNVTIIPAPGAFSLAAARMGWALADPMLTCVSVHARPFETLRRLIRPGVRLLILSRDGKTPGQVAAMLARNGYGESPVTILERMGGAQEKRTDIIAGDGVPAHVDNLNTLAVECVAGMGARPLSNVPGLPDDAYEHDGTITKREVRAVTLAALGPRPGETLWDIGAGSGTVAIEWLRAEPAAHAIAFEKDSVRAARITGNAKALGVPTLEVIEGTFPHADLPGPPDAIFVGGGIAGHSGLLDTCLDVLKPGGRLVANAVTLEAQERMMAAKRTHGGELVRMGISHEAAVGPLSALKPALDVLQWRILRL